MGHTTFTVTDEELMLMSSKNPELRFERNADGTIITMAPTGGISSNREAKAITYLTIWVEDHDLGEVFSSSGGFRLPNGAVRAPDAAFVAKGRLADNWDEEDDKFLPLAPDFVIEIRSKSDSLEVLQDKMQEYIDNGAILGLLINRQNRTVQTYRPDRPSELLNDPETVSCDPELPGFTLQMTRIW